MFKKFGQKFIQGAKAEILKPDGETIDWEKILNAGVKLLELGIFAFAMLGGHKESKQAVIVNNYIWRDE